MLEPARYLTLETGSVVSRRHTQAIVSRQHFDCDLSLKMRVFSEENSSLATATESSQHLITTNFSRPGCLHRTYAPIHTVAVRRPYAGDCTPRSYTLSLFIDASQILFSKIIFGYIL